MQQRLALSQRAFYVGLLMMLGSGILSATVWPAGGYRLTILVLLGAMLALGARLWHRRLCRSALRRDHFTDLAGYPLDLLRDLRFSASRRPGA